MTTKGQGSWETEMTVETQLVRSDGTLKDMSRTKGVDLGLLYLKGLDLGLLRTDVGPTPKGPRVGN